MKYLAATILTWISTYGLVMADEVWDSEFGDRLVYERDVDSTAILADDRRWFFIEDLAGNHSNRNGVFRGYWMTPPEFANDYTTECRSSRTFADGRTTRHWGPVLIQFNAPTFPTGFVMGLGYCDDLMGDDTYQLAGTTSYIQYQPVTAGIPESEPDGDWGYNSTEPGMNQELECTDYLIRYHGAESFGNIQRNLQMEADNVWEIRGLMSTHDRYGLGFYCIHRGGRVVRTGIFDMGE